MYVEERGKKVERKHNERDGASYAKIFNGE